MKITNKKESSTGIKNVKKIEFTRNNKKNINYIHYTPDKSTIMSYLDLLLKSMEVEGFDIIIIDEQLFNKSIIESRKNQYSNQCNVLGIINDKDPDSFYDLYSEWPIPNGRWSIHKFDGSELFTIQRKDKKSVLKLVDDLNNGRPYPFKIIETDYSNKYGIGVKCSKKNNGLI